MKLARTVFTFEIDSYEKSKFHPVDILMDQINDQIPAENIVGIQMHTDFKNTLKLDKEDPFRNPYIPGKVWMEVYHRTNKRDQTPKVGGMFAILHTVFYDGHIENEMIPKLHETSENAMEEASLRAESMTRTLGEEFKVVSEDCTVTVVNRNTAQVVMTYKVYQFGGT